MKIGSIDYFKDMHKKMMDKITPDALERRFKCEMIDAASFEKEFKEDTDVFRKFCYNYAQSLVPGRVSAALYSAVVSAVARNYDTDYQVKAGYCLLKSSSKYEDDKKKYLEQRKAGGDMVVTHVYVEACGKTYDYYGGLGREVDHIDCERIDNV